MFLTFPLCRMIKTSFISSQPVPLRIKELRYKIKASYFFVIELEGATYNAWCPDVLGCVATSTSLEKVKQLIKDGLGLHLSALLERGLGVPKPTTSSISQLSGELAVDDNEVVETGIVDVEIAC